MSDDDAYESYSRGYALHVGGGDVAEAEAAYGRAIAGGYVDASLQLGLLLGSQHGREGEAEAAFRTAMSSTDPMISSRAALELGIVLDTVRNDLAGASECLRFAQAHGTGPVRERATIDLAFLLAYVGERELAAEHLRTFIEARGGAGGHDLSSVSARLAAFWVGLAGARWTRRPWRRWRVTTMRARRRWRSLRTGRRGAGSWGRAGR